MAEQQVDLFMQAIRSKESGGNYKAVGQPTKYGRATGAYQFLDSTWNGYGGYARAADAPPEVQDRAAREKMLRLYKNYGDWRKVAMAWYAGDFSKKDVNRKQTAGGKVFPSIAEYGEDVMRRMGQGRDDPIRAQKVSKQVAAPKPPEPKKDLHMTARNLAQLMAGHFQMDQQVLEEVLLEFGERLAARLTGGFAEVPLETKPLANDFSSLGRVMSVFDSLQPPPREIPTMPTKGPI